MISRGHTVLLCIVSFPICAKYHHFDFVLQLIAALFPLCCMKTMLLCMEWSFGLLFFFVVFTGGVNRN